MKTKYDVEFDENKIIIDMDEANELNSLEEVEKHIAEYIKDNNIVFKKYYTVVFDRKAIIFNDNGLAQKARKGQTHYKSFPKISEAIDYIRLYTSGPCAPENFIKRDDIEYDKLIENNIEDGYLPIFTDGSYSEDGIVGYGYYAIIKNNAANPEKNKFFWDNGKKTGFEESHQVSGETYGIIRSIEAALEKGYSKIWIYSDFALAYEWYYGCKGTTKEVGKDYIKKMKKLKNREGVEDIKITWTKGHNGIFGNEAADFLAGKITGKLYEDKHGYKDYFEKELIK